MTTPPHVNKLKAAMHGMQASDARPAAEVVPLTQSTKKYPVTPSRIGKKMVAAYFAPDAVKQLHLLCVERDMTVQAVIEEALNDFFRKYGRSAIV